MTDFKSIHYSVKVSPSKYLTYMLNRLFIDLSVVSSAITAKQEASLTSEETLDKISPPISVINSFRVSGLKYVALGFVYKRLHFARKNKN